MRPAAQPSIMRHQTRGIVSCVVHFEIQASQPQPLMDFYSGLFGWSFAKWEGPAEYWLIETGPSDTPGIKRASAAAGLAPMAEMLLSIPSYVRWRLCLGRSL